MLWEITVDTFLNAVRTNIGKYDCLSKVYLPIVELRVQRHRNLAEDLLVNSIFRWCYSNSGERLGGLEEELKKLEKALGSDFLNYWDDVKGNIANQPTENQTYDRMLDARAEIRGMLHYAKSGCSTKMKPKQPNDETYDFDAKASDGSNIAVEAKFIRHPDPLRVYLMRWWDAACIISGTRPLGNIPYIKFKWNPIHGDLSLKEIKELKEFFQKVFLNPDSDKSLSEKRMRISYSPKNKLPLSTMPLGTIEAGCEHPVDLLMKKIRKVIEEKAIPQLSGARGRKVCYFLVNITGDIEFEYPQEYKNDKKTLKKDYRSKGLEILIKEVGYL